MAVTKEEVRETYKKNFGALKDTAAAWNRTLEELSPPFRQDMPEDELEARQEVGRFLREITDEVELELGDPFQVAVHEAVESLKADGVVEKARAYWKEILEGAAKIPKGPKEWTPRREELEEEAAQKLEGPYLYILFDDRGCLQGWTIDFPDYFQGHGGPVAAVLLSDALDYGEIGREIADTLGQADIDWEGAAEE